MRLSPGTKLGPYEIQSPLGAGGMGEVYRARDSRLDRTVAIKVLPAHVASDPELKQRFEREARTVAALNHPHICTLHDIGQQDGTDFLVMEYLEGETLAQRLTKGAVQVDQALTIAIEIADALDKAHRQRIVHRDIKPSNVMLTESGAKVLDFGIAVRFGGADLETVTRSTAAMNGRDGIAGTLPYMAPEVLGGDPADERSDIWSLGVLLYEAVTGTRPFLGRTGAAVTSAILRDQPEALPPSLPSALPRIVLRCLAKEPGRRYQRAGEVRAAMEAIGGITGGWAIRSRADGETVQPAPAQESASGRRRARPGVVPVVLSALALAALLVGAYVAGWLPGSPESAVTSPSEYIQLTNFTDSATAPALSPDGRMVTFIRGGGYFLSRGQIYVKRLPNGESVRMTNDEKLKYGPVFTLDGSRITYTVVEQSEQSTFLWDTWTVPVLGGQPTRLLPNASGLVWLDDRRLLFSEVKGTGLHMGIVTATETRSEQREIYFPTHERGMAHFSWASLDRQWVLLAEMDPSWHPCRLVPFAGSSAGRQVGPRGACRSAAWSPDGGWMYFSAVVDGASHLWRQRFPDGPPEQITFGPSEEEGVALALDGASVVTSVGVRRSSIWLHDTTGDHQVSAEGDAFAPQLSPDGRRVYYLLRRNRMSPTYELRVLHLDSGHTENVLSNLSLRDPGSFPYDVSPDEREVVFTLRGSEGEPEIWLAPLDRRAPPRLIARAARRVSFGPDGDLLFVSLEEEANFLSRIKKDGSGRERVSNIPVLVKFGVSPDGNWTLAGVPGTGEQEAPETLAIPTGGGAPQRVCSHPCPGRWSADGRFLYLSTLVHKFGNV